MKISWSRTVFPIAALFSFRMLGLFMLIPVFTVEATQLTYATPSLIGIALGSYGLSQGMLQIPFGMLSDRFGRKNIITLGLFLFGCGSLMGALSHSIYGMIFARIVQGAGAIGSVLIALLADLTPDEQRTRSMAVIGVTIGLSFSLAMVLSPAITHYFGLSGIFYLTTCFALLGLLLLHGVVPTPTKEIFHLDSEAQPAFFRQVLLNRHLQRLNIGIFCQHFILTSTFFSVPMLLQKQLQLGHLSQQWQFYLPLMLFAFLAMVPFIILAEKKQQMKCIFILSIALSSVAQLLLVFTYQSWIGICTLMFLYFMSFNILEATLPSLVSKQASSDCKGTAMGIYSTCQFLGIFAGGAIAGLLYQFHGTKSLFMLNAAIGFLWFGTALFMQPNAYQLTLTIAYPPNRIMDKKLQAIFKALPGVIYICLSPTEEVMYLRVDKAKYSSGAVEHLLAQGQKEE